MKNILKIISFITLIFISTIWLTNYIIEKSAKGKTYNSMSEIPKNKVGLLLGTSKNLMDGRTNLYYTYRLEAALKLYKAGKIQYILVSGDNSRKDYDEPSDFRGDLIQNGVPKEKIFLDYAGFRTLDSMVRAKEIFGLDSITIISQKFHNERAIYLAQHYNIDAIAFNAKDVNRHYGFKTKIREYFARTKASLDILFHVKPKFLGKKIEIK